MSCKPKEEIEKAKAESLNILKALYQQIVKLSEDVVPLYDNIENYFFQEVDYQVLKSENQGDRNFHTLTIHQ